MNDAQGGQWLVNYETGAWVPFDPDNAEVLDQLLEDTGDILHGTADLDGWHRSVSTTAAEHGDLFDVARVAPAAGKPVPGAVVGVTVDLLPGGTDPRVGTWTDLVRIEVDAVVKENPVTLGVVVPLPLFLLASNPEAAAAGGRGLGDGDSVAVPVLGDREETGDGAFATVGVGYRTPDGRPVSGFGWVTSIAGVDDGVRASLSPAVTEAVVDCAVGLLGGFVEAG
ncbi:MAG: hypothetical protein GY882_11925 [Actinomycetia bacterium]|nr:hypothetical protein [Actinomycetes bacterium]